MTDQSPAERKLIQVILEKVQGMKLDLSKVNQDDLGIWGEARAYNEALDNVIEMLQQMDKV